MSALWNAYVPTMTTWTGTNTYVPSITYGGGGGSASSLSSLPAKPKTALAWLDDEVEKVCAVARDAS